MAAILRLPTSNEKARTWLCVDRRHPQPAGIDKKTKTVLLKSQKEVSIDKLINPDHLVGSESYLNLNAPATMHMPDSNALTIPEFPS